MPPTTPQTPADAFAQIIATMLAMVGARVARPWKPGLAGPLTLAIAIRLQRMRNRIASFAARFRAGTLTPPRKRPARPPRRPRTTPGPWDHLPKLPRGKLWLVKLVPGIGVAGNYLRILLEDPEMAAMLQAAPQIGRTLRPFWYMLSGEPLPPLLQHPAPASPVAPMPPPPAAPETTAPARAAQPAPARPPRRPLPAPEVAAPTLPLPVPA